MARPLDERKRISIMQATETLVAEQGPSASTAEIAKAAGVPHGSIFTYFQSKASLLNAVYLNLKSDLTREILVSVDSNADLRMQLLQFWHTRVNWGVANPIRRRAMTQLSVSELITDESRQMALEEIRPGLEIIRKAASKGALRGAPANFSFALFEAIAGATMDFMADDAKNAEATRESGFDALWSALT